MESTITVNANVSEQQRKNMNKMEREMYAMSQYSRRECIEVVGIPQTVDDTILKNKVCSILESIGVQVTPDKIEACHRLRKKERTIVKFSSRKTCVEALNNRKRLKELDRKK